MMKTRIVLVDDHRVLLDALRSLVEAEFEVVGMFEDCQSLLKQAAILQPDIVVLDIGIGPSIFTPHVPLSLVTRWEHRHGRLSQAMSQNAKRAPNRCP